MTSEIKPNSSSQNTNFCSNEHAVSTIFPNSQSTTNSHHRRTKWLIALLVLFVFLLVGVAFAFINRSALVNSIPDVDFLPTAFNPSPKTSIAPSATVADTSTWQNYRNEEYGFEFKYPNNLSDKCCTMYSDKYENMDNIITLAESLDTQFEGGAEVVNGITISVGSSSDSQSLSDFVELQLLEHLRKFYKDPTTLSNVRSNIQTSTSTIGQSPSIRVPSFGVYNSEVYFVSLENERNIIAISKSEQHSSDFAKTFDQIVSTFQFTDPVESNSILQIKFSSDTDLTNPELLLPAGVRISVKSIRPLFSVNPSELKRIDQNGNDLRYWYELSLKDGVQVDDILPLLKSSSNISTVEKAPLPAPPPTNLDQCVVGGCSGQLCIEDTPDGLSTTCEWLEKYQCYRTAECTRQSDGECGWTKTTELLKCLETKR